MIILCFLSPLRVLSTGPGALPGLAGASSGHQGDDSRNASCPAAWHPPVGLLAKPRGAHGYVECALTGVELFKSPVARR